MGALLLMAHHILGMDHLVPLVMQMPVQAVMVVVIVAALFALWKTVAMAIQVLSRVVFMFTVVAAAAGLVTVLAAALRALEARALALALQVMAIRLAAGHQEPIMVLAVVDPIVQEGRARVLPERLFWLCQ